MENGSREVISNFQNVTFDKKGNLKINELSK